MTIMNYYDYYDYYYCYCNVYNIIDSRRLDVEHGTKRIWIAGRAAAAAAGASVSRTIGPWFLFL